MDENKKPFPQFIEKNPKKHFYWAVFLLLVLTALSCLLIVLEKFKVDEEIESLQPGIKIQQGNQKVIHVQEPLPDIQAGYPQIEPDPCIGDLNWDDNVDSGDLQLAKEAIGTRVGDMTYNSVADINGDGEINFWDIRLIEKNLDCKSFVTN